MSVVLKFSLSLLVRPFSQASQKVLHCTQEVRALQPEHESSSATEHCGLVAMTSASHAEGRQLDPGQVYALWRVRSN